VGLRPLAAAADARWSFVGQRAHAQGLGSALDARTRPSLAVHLGARSRERARPWWAKSPWGARAQATGHPEHATASRGVMPATPQPALPQHARSTNHLARFQNTWRPRVARLVRDTRSCSKQLAQQIGAIT
jgi:insertion element IS1 protein InsB